MPTEALHEHTRILNAQTQTLSEHGKMVPEILGRVAGAQASAAGS